MKEAKGGFYVHDDGNEFLFGHAHIVCGSYVGIDLYLVGIIEA